MDEDYYQGEPEDNGEVLALGEQATVPGGTYDDLLKTAETTPLNPTCSSTSTTSVGLFLTIDGEAGGREELLAVTRVPPAEARRAGLAPLGGSY